jgi:hypothetical protein
VVALGERDGSPACLASDYRTSACSTCPEADTKMMAMDCRVQTQQLKRKRVNNERIAAKTCSGGGWDKKTRGSRALTVVFSARKGEMSATGRMQQESRRHKLTPGPTAQRMATGRLQFSRGNKTGAGRALQPLDGGVQIRPQPTHLQTCAPRLVQERSQHVESQPLKLLLYYRSTTFSNVQLLPVYMPQAATATRGSP